MQGAAGARELLEIAEALHDEGLTERDVKFFRKPIAEIACATITEPGQARLVEKLFDVFVQLKELDEIIERTRKDLDLPTKQKKRLLCRLISIRDGIEPSCGEITRDAELLELHAAVRRLLRRKAVRPAGEMRRLNRARNIEM